jgi:signal transduction histidine kinase
MKIKKINIGLDKRKILGFIGAFLLLLISYLLLIYNTRKMFEQSRLVERTNQVIINLESMVSNLKEIEFSYRGLIITGETKYWDDFYRYCASNDSLYPQLFQLLKSNSFQQKNLAEIKSKMDSKTKQAAIGMNYFRQHPETKDSLLTFGYSGEYTGKTSELVRTMQEYEMQVLRDMDTDLESFTKAIHFINLTSLFIAFLLAIYSSITYIAENRQRTKSDVKAGEYREELEKRVAELSKANKELTSLRSIEKFASSGRIARTIAHEVRNPLTNIHLAVEQLKDSLPASNTEESDMLLNMISRNGNRINQLIADLLNATKFSELNFKNIKLHTLLESALELANDRIELNQVAIIKKFYAGDSYIKVDGDKLKIAFLNIIVNAIEAMEPGKAKLQISTFVEDGYCKIIFEDNGIGMDEEMLSRLFEPFFTNKQNGNGLGLTNTQNIILNHKGTIEVFSKSGEGTSFVITLEAVSDKEVKAEQYPAV